MLAMVLSKIQQGNRNHFKSFKQREMTVGTSIGKAKKPSRLVGPRRGQ